MSKNVNTSKSIDTPTNSTKKTAGQLEQELARGVEKYSKDLVDFSIPKAFAKKLGSVCYIGVNGVTVGINVDGKKYKVPKAHANRLNEIINNLS